MSELVERTRDTGAASSIDQVDMGLPASFVWSYDQASPPVARLYERAKAGQWNAAVDLDWMVNVDPGAEAPPEARGGIDWSQVGGPFTERLAADRVLRREFAAQQHGWLISQFMHGEQGALLAAAKICAAAESLDDKLFAAVQVGDEARHLEAYQRYLGKIGITYPCSPPLAELLAQVMSHPHVDLTYLGMQILVEGVALAAFSVGGSLAANPLIARLTELVRRDEARHVAFGVLSLQGLYDDMDPVDLREREDFVVESCALLRDRLLPVEVWEHFGLDTTVATARFLESVESQAFRSVVFSKVVPNLRKLGLLTPRVRDDFETLGILHYEQYTDSATEGGELAAGELRGADPRDPLKVLRDSLRTVDVIPPEPVLAVFTSLVDHSKLTCVTPTRIRLRVSGVAEGDWLLTFGIGAVKYRMLRPIEGPEVADITLDLDAHTWTDLVAGRTAWYRAVIDGRVRVEGDVGRLLPLDNLL